MKIGIVGYSNDSETVCSSFRFFLVLKDDEENIGFLLGKSIECESLDSDRIVTF